MDNKRPKDRDLDGTAGFSPQLAGHGKAGESNTSGFGSGPMDDTLAEYPPEDETAEQDSGAKQPTTSSASIKAGKRQQRRLNEAI